MRYAVVIERGDRNYGAYVPDLPGCVAVGESVDEVRELIRQAVDLHLDGLKEDGETIPEATTLCEYVDAVDSSDELT